jgi:hypothetical protein
MTVGTDIAPADPAVIRTGDIWAEVVTGINLTAATSGESHAGWRRAGCRQVPYRALFTPLTFGLLNVTGKGFGFAFASGRLWHCGSGLVDAPKPSNQQHQHDEESTNERIKNELESHDQPLQSGGKWADHTAF